MKQPQKEADVKKRGAVAMGFDQDATRHHFILTKEGGRIEVTVKDHSDRVNLTAVRAHLEQIASAFTNGDFSAPFAKHGQEPPGVAEMRTLRALLFATGTMRHRMAAGSSSPQPMRKHKPRFTLSCNTRFANTPPAIPRRSGSR